MQVCHHPVRTPAAKKLDFFVINAYQEEGHGTASAHGSGADVLGEKAQFGAGGAGGEAESDGDIITVDPLTLGTMWDGGEGCVRCGSSLAEREF